MKENGTWPFYVCTPKGIQIYNSTMPTSPEMLDAVKEFTKLQAQPNPIPEIQ